MNVFFNRILASSEIKEVAKYVEAYFDKFETGIEFKGFSGNRILKNIRRDTLIATFSKEMKNNFSDGELPNSEYQALHTTGQMIYTCFCREPLVDIGGGSFCSGSLRDAFGNLTDEGINLKILYHAVMDKIIGKKFEKEGSEYIKNNTDVIDDAAKPNTNMHISGY